MTNEILLLLSVLVLYGAVLAWMRFFGTKGLPALLAIATIAANIEVLILIEAFGMTQTLGNILFASTFLITDILSETRGKKQAQYAVNIGIATSAIFILISQSWLLYTPSGDDIFHPLISQVFSTTPRLMLSSLVVYAICQRIDVWLYHKIWSITEKKYGAKAMLWLRNNGSTITTQLINSFLFNFAAFYGVFANGTIVAIALSSFAIFAVTSVMDTPFIYAARKIAEKEQHGKS